MIPKTVTHHRKNQFTSHGCKQVVKSFILNIPSKYIVTLGKLLGSLFYILDMPHRRIVARNLHFSHPDWSKEHIQRMSKRIFHNLGITILEVIQLSHCSCEDLLGRIRIVGEQHLMRALEKNTGLIIISAHLGNWEVGLQYTTCFLNVPITGVAKKIRFAPLNRWVTRLRTRFGIRIISKKGALSEMRQTLRQGEILALLIDQSKRSEGVDVNFFGRLVKTTPSAAMLAIRCNSPVLPMFCVREKDGRLTIHVQPPLALKRTQDLRTDIITNTQIMTDVVEKAVRKYTDQWLWLHKRWKRHYPHLYPKYDARRQQRKRREERRAQKMAR